MDKYIHAFLFSNISLLKTWNLLKKAENFNSKLVNLVSLLTEITVDRGACLSLVISSELEAVQ